MIKSYFDSLQLVLLSLSILFFTTSLIFKLKDRNNWSIIFLTTSAFFLYAFAALLDPFLNLWDERFHALVAKNLISEPFKPMLYANPILEMAYDNWDRYHIWLHKQPLFLWQMAISMKLFGVNEFALRLPNVIMATLLIPTIYRIGQLLVNKNIGYLAAALLISTVYVLDLVSGRQVLEHNDLAFMFYVTCSIWAFIEYRISKNIKWIYLIGVFVGLAILVKWLVGLLVFFGWIVLRIQEKKFSLSQNKDIAISALVAFCISIPWQVYTFWRFPKEALAAYKFNGLHFTIPLEGHSGGFWWHFNKFDLLYGALGSFLVIPGMIILYKKIKDKQMFIALMSMALVVYLFFSLAATKMPSFTIILISIVLISFASLLQFGYEWIKSTFRKNKLIYSAVFLISMLTIFFIRIDITQLQTKYTLWKNHNQYSRKLIHNRQIFKSLNLPDNAVLFNVKGRHYIEAMYYTKHIAYNFFPSPKQMAELKSKNYRAVVFKGPNMVLPEHLKNDDEVIIIRKQIKGYR